MYFYLETMIALTEFHWKLVQRQGKKIFFSGECVSSHCVGTELDKALCIEIREHEICEV